MASSLFGGDLQYTTGPSTTGSSNVTQTGGQETSDQYTGQFKDLADFIAQYAKGLGQSTTPQSDGGAADASDKAQAATDSNFLQQMQQYAQQAASGGASSQYFDQIMRNLMNQQGWDSSAYDATRNPYTQAVVDTTLQAMDDKAAQDQAALSRSLAGQKAFGTRGQIAQALQESEANKGRAATQAQLQSEAYDKALAAWQADQARSLQGQQAALSGDIQDRQTKISGAGTAADIAQGGMSTWMDALAKQANISTAELEQRLASSGLDINKLNAMVNALSQGTKKETTVEQKKTNQSSSTSTEIPDVPDIIDDILEGRDTGTGTGTGTGGTGTGGTGTGTGGTGTGTGGTGTGTGGTGTGGTGTGTGGTGGGTGTTPTRPSGVPADYVWDQSSGTWMNPNGTGPTYDQNGNDTGNTGTGPSPTDPATGLPTGVPAGSTKNTDGTYTAPDGTLYGQDGKPVFEVPGTGGGTGTWTPPSGYQKQQNGTWKDLSTGNYYNSDGKRVDINGNMYPETTPSWVNPETAYWQDGVWYDKATGKPIASPTDWGDNPPPSNTQNYIQGTVSNVLDKANIGGMTVGTDTHGTTGFLPLSGGGGLGINYGAPNQFAILTSGGGVSGYYLLNQDGSITYNSGGSRYTFRNDSLSSLLGYMQSRAPSGMAKGGFFEVGKISGRLDDENIEEAMEDTVEIDEDEDVAVPGEDLDDATLEEHADIAISILSSVMPEEEAVDLLLEYMDRGMSAIEAARAILSMRGIEAEDEETPAMATGGFVDWIPGSIRRTFGMYPGVQDEIEAELKAARVNQLANDPLSATAVSTVAPGVVAAPVAAAENAMTSRLLAPANVAEAGAFGPVDDAAQAKAADPYEQLAQGMFTGAGLLNLRGLQGGMDAFDLATRSGEDVPFKYDPLSFWKSFAKTGEDPNRLSMEAAIASGFADTPWGMAAKGLQTLADRDAATQIAAYEADRWNRNNRRDASTELRNLLTNTDPYMNSTIARAAMFDPELGAVLGQTAGGIGEPLVIAGKRYEGLTRADFDKLDAKAKIDLLSNEKFGTAVDDKGLPESDTIIKFSPTSFGRAANDIWGLTDVDLAAQAGTLEGPALEDYQSKKKGILFEDPLLIGREIRAAKGAASPEYQSVDQVGSEMGQETVTQLSEFYKPMANFESKMLTGLGSGTKGGRQAVLQKMALGLRAQLFDEMARSRYEAEKTAAEEQGKEIVPYDQFSKKLYGAYSLEKKDKDGRPVITDTTVPSPDQVGNKMASLPASQADVVNKARVRLASGTGSIDDVKTIEDALGFGSYLYFLPKGQR